MSREHAPAITVFIPDSFAPLSAGFEASIHEELAHIIGEGLYKTVGVPREQIVNAKVIIIATDNLPELHSGVREGVPEHIRGDIV
jgi:hypothetical protein